MSRPTQGGDECRLPLNTHNLRSIGALLSLWTEETDVEKEVEGQDGGFADSGQGGIGVWG